MKKIFCIFTSTNDVNSIIHIYQDLINEIINNSQIFLVINFYNYENSKKNLIYKNKIISNFAKKINILNIKSAKDFKKFLERYNKVIAIDCLGTKIKNIPTRRIINDEKIFLIRIFGTGSISNISSESKVFFIKKKINYIIFRLLVFFKFLSAFHIYFDTRKEIVQNIKNKNKIHIKVLLDKFLNFILYKKVILINSSAYDYYIKNKEKNKNKNYITFLDGNYKHRDIILRENINLELVKKKYFSQLNRLFKNLEKKFNSSVEICLHPSSNINTYKKYFKNYKISKFETRKKIYKSKIVLFHESSAIIDAIITKKKIISIQTKLLGDYYFNRIERYIKIFNTNVINLDKQTNIEKIKLKINHIKYNRYKNLYIMADNTVTSSKKISRILGKI